jgi:hypothetical protein
MAPYTLSDLFCALTDRVRTELAECNRLTGWGRFVVATAFAPVQAPAAPLDERQQAAAEQLRVMAQITAMLVDCMASQEPATHTMGLAYENTSRAMAVLAENVRHVATLSRV